MAKDTCTVERMVLTTSCEISMVTGERHNERIAWKIRCCGTPLFGEEREDGICHSCKSGWTHENNYPTVLGKLEIANHHAE